MSDKKNKQKKFKKRGQDSSSSTSSSSESTSSLSSEDESNANDLKPIKDYLNDRKELARQLFLAVKGDKLRMMLPQVLKKMEIKELEEWCANELSGMSKARILSIINGHPMLQSSDSNDSDDSGPSLEIISDTEEWGDVSDLETLAREEDSASKKASGSKKDKSRASKRVRSVLDKGNNKETEKSKSKSLMKGKLKSEGDPKSQKSNDLVKIKKEAAEENEQQAKEKDGESLLDLLELEMRARAIRALIRKEEDIIPTNPSGSANANASAQSQSGTSNQASKADSNVATTSKNRARDRQLSLKVVQDKLQELDNSFNRNLDKNTQEISEEEDVVLVLAPTTTIELLSSESEDEGGQGKRRNQKLENERIPEKNKTSVPHETEREKIVQLNEKGEKEAESQPSATEKTDLSTPSSNQTKNLSEEGVKTVEKSPKKVSTDLEKFRKFKRKSHIKEIGDIEKIQEDNSSDLNCGEKESSSEILQSEKNSSEPISEDKTEEVSNNMENDGLKNDENKPEENVEEEVDETVPKESEEETKKLAKEKELKQEAIDEDKSTDLEIIIDLDDYPDDMEDLENGGDKAKTEKFNPNSNPEDKKVEIEKEEAVKSSEMTEGRSAETWATRYYQTDDVQSVIKESKIQSEIRKRLRERQRLARLNNSPNLNSNTGQNVTTPGPTLGAEKISQEKEESPATLGSVEEYLALKNVEAVIPAAENDGGVTEEKKEIEKDLNIEKLVILGDGNDEKIELGDINQQKLGLEINKDCDEGGE